MKQILFLCIFFLSFLAFGKAPKVVITLDDFPMGSSVLFDKKERVRIFLEKLAQNEVATVFYCIGEQVESKEGQACLELLNGSDHFLANHSYQHLHLSKISLKTFEEELLKTEALLSSHPNYRRLFRFPYLDVGDHADRGGSNRKRVAAFQLLRNKGYEHGYVTINTFDWYIDGQLKKMVSAGRSVNWEHLKEAYLFLLGEWMDDYQAKWSQTTLKPLTHVLLLHQNDLNALFLTDVIDFIRKKWVIVPPEEAFNHPHPYLARFANSKKGLFKMPPALSTDYIDAVLSRLEVFEQDKNTLKIN